MNKHVNVLVILVALLLLFAGCNAQPDPKSVIEELGQAEAAKDLEAIMDFFAEDVVFELPDGFQYKGKEEVRIFFQNQHKSRRNWKYENIEAEGNRVTWVIRIIESEEGFLTEAIVENGKVVYMYALGPAP